MRYAILSDIHGNFEALSAVLYQIKRQAINDVLVTGDIVGYGPEPHECIEALRDINAKVVGGNHDLATSGRISFKGWRNDAAEIWSWNQRVLPKADLDWLFGLPLTYITKNFTLVHGSIEYPHHEYVHGVVEARRSQRWLTNKICFFGHTHIPYAFKLHEGGTWDEKNFKLIDQLWLNSEDTFFVNPGSVGQPRDGNNKASYMVYDTHQKNIIISRIGYDIEKTQFKMKKLNFPLWFLQRLSRGN